MLKSRTHTLCLVSVLAALYVPLSIFVAVQMGNVRISFGSLPVVVSALLLGPVEAVAVAMVGEFFKQLLTYGITATTVLYLIPPALRGLVVGLAAASSLRHGRPLEQRKMICFPVCICAAMLTTFGNTMVNLIDSILNGYYTPALIFGDAVYRFAVGMINAVVMATLAIPLTTILRRQFRYMFSK
ncbi:MAG: folate family ECF transporter S component [Oscillibacter sp.]|nr:folate family ECF transporter S component [Oscillibacter sp.]